MQKPFLPGKKVYLRSVELEDAQLLVQWNSQPDVRHSFFIGFPTNTNRQQEWIQNLYKDKDFIIFIIMSVETDEPLGFTGFYRIDWIGRAATYGIIIGDPKNWGKGFGSEVTRLMVEYGFKTLNLNRIQLHVWKDNLSGLKAYKKTGFKKEGLLREAMYHSGKFEDFYIMSILHKEFNTGKLK